MNPKRIILDVDTGHDDAVAIMLAASAPELSLDAITVTAGNQTLDKTLRNTLNLCDALCIDAPVYPGADRPLLRDLVPASRIHGESGFDGPLFTNVRKRAESTHAALAIVEKIMDSPPETYTLIAVGPLSNIALAVRLEPAIASRLRELIVMGGSAGRGNVTPSAEFNIHADPESAHIVFESGAPLTMIGLDVTTRVVLDEARLKETSTISGRAAEIFAQSMKNYMAACRSFLGEFPAMHDPTCVAYAINPSILRLEQYRVDIECHGGHTTGRTVVDFAGVTGNPVNVRLATDVSPTLFWPLLERALRSWAV